MSKKGKSSGSGEQLICRNPKAERNFEVEERIEAGLVLTGSEVKSLRAKHADLEGAYASIENMELFLFHMHIGPYRQAGHFGHEEKRRRKLLAHKHEIEDFATRVAEKGLTLIPLRLYFKDGRVKAEIALARGKEGIDKRRALAERDVRREIDREIKSRFRG